MSTPNTQRPGTKGRPDIAHAMLGRQLRVLRESRRVSRAAAERHIGGSHSKISRIESGRTGVKEDDLDRLLDLYGVNDPKERQAMLELTCRLNHRQWWQAHSEILGGWFCSYLVFESIAEYIRTYEVRFIPGLLQTRAYAEAVVRLHYHNEDEVRRRVEARMLRQEVLLRQGTPRLWAVVDEAALYEQIGGPDVMRQQIDFLAQVAAKPQLHIQVLPSGAAGRVGIGNSFSMLRLRLKNLSDVVYLEHIGSALFLENPDDLDPYKIAMTRLSLAAGKAEETTDALRNARGRHSQAR